MKKLKYKIKKFKCTCGKDLEIVCESNYCGDYWFREFWCLSCGKKYVLESAIQGLREDISLKHHRDLFELYFKKYNAALY